MSVIAIDGAAGEGGGQILRTALSLSAATGQAFEIKKIRARRSRAGLRPQHLAAVRALAMACEARVHGAFEGSLELRFEPGPVAAGDFRFEIETAGASTLVLQCALAPLALAQAPSLVAVTGGTHVPASPSFHYLDRHWGPALAGLGLRARLRLHKAGFYPRGGGEVSAQVEPWARGGSLFLDERGPLRRVFGVSGAGKLRGNVAERQRDAARDRLWEERRLEAEWETLAVPSAGPGSFLLLGAEFESGRAAFAYLGEKGVRAEILGDRAARALLRFLESEGAVDAHLADQLAVPIALAGGGGRVTTPEVTRHLETVASVVTQFGIPARTWGRRGGPGGLEVERV